jgi:hypothetical protein
VRLELTVLWEQLAQQVRLELMAQQDQPAHKD